MKYLQRLNTVFCARKRKIKIKMKLKEKQPKRNLNSNQGSRLENK